VHISRTRSIPRPVHPQLCCSYNSAAELLEDGSTKERYVDDEKECAFSELKQKICGAPLLQLPDMGQELTLQTDASTQSIGAVLLQETDQGLLPIEYASRTLREPQKRYPTGELECLAVACATKKFEEYLYGKPFTQ